MKTIEDMFACLDEQAMSELLENQSVESGKASTDNIKSLSMKKAGFEYEKKSKNNLRRISAKKILSFAASIVVVVGCFTFFAMYMKNKNEPVVTAPPQTTADESTENPLILAISKGNDKLIDTLLKNPIFVNEQVLDFAVNCTDLLSYSTVQNIAKAVENIFGSTGLDSLLEDALLGKSDEVIKELEKSDALSMSAAQRLAFFFTAAFCDSEAIEKFVEKGADINSTDVNGNNIGEIALKYNNGDAQQYAAAHGIS